MTGLWYLLSRAVACRTLARDEIGYTVGLLSAVAAQLRVAPADLVARAGVSADVGDAGLVVPPGDADALAAAALKSKTAHVGYIGGVQTPLLEVFQAGFDAGAKAVNPSIKIDAKYLTQIPDYSGFADPAKGKVTGEGMFQGGADVIFAAAGSPVVLCFQV